MSIKFESPVSEVFPLTNKKNASSCFISILFLIIKLNCDTVKSLGTKYLVLSMSLILDFGSFSQYIYLIISIILLIILLVFLRKLKKEKVNKIIKFTTIFLIIIYIVKTVWETIYDLKYDGSFNTGLLPFDSCSIIMLAGILSSFCKGKIKDYSSSWLATGCIVGGISNLLFLNAFKYYPFLSFGAFYSMLWHFLMVFIGLLVIVSNYVEISYKTVIKGFIFHLIISLFIIPIDFNISSMKYALLAS